MPSNQWDSDVYQNNVAFVPALGRDVLSLLAATKSERVLDLGCGEGALTVELAQQAGQVVGVDRSPKMVAAARERGIAAFVCDAAHLDRLLVSGELAAESFDAVFTNAALHWITEVEELLSGVRMLLRPGGRFVGEFGGHGNISTIGTALNASLAVHGFAQVGNPFYFPTAIEFSDRLVNAGFLVSHVELFSRPTRLPTGLRGWVDAFGTPFLELLTQHERAQVVSTAEEFASSWLRDDEGNWTADYVRLRFEARSLD